MDIAAPESAPQVYEVRAHFTHAEGRRGLQLRVRASRGRWRTSAFTGRDEFARPTLLIDWIELEGPVHASWPPPSHQRVLFASPNKDRDEKAYAREVITRFMARAYRRPVNAAEVDAKVALFEKHRAEKPTFTEAIKVPLAAVLASPHFLYLVEPEAPQAKPRALTPYELASRLSYFLWSSMPDDELFRLAAAGELAKPAVLRAQVNRMLADPRAGDFVKNFAGQWLGLRKVGANPPSKTLYPEYDRHLELSIVRETEGFFARDPPRRSRCAQPHQERLRHHQRTPRALLRHPRREGRRDPPRARAAGVASRRTRHAGIHAQHHLQRHAHLARRARRVGAEDAARHRPRAAGGECRRDPVQGARHRQGHRAAAPRRFTARPRRARAATTRSIRSASRWKISTPPANGATRRATATMAASTRTTPSSTPARRCPMARSSKASKGCSSSF